MTEAEMKNDPFVQLEGKETISPEEMLKLLNALNLSTSDAELQSLLQRAQKGESIEREAIVSVVTAMIASDEKHLGELTETIGDFEIQL
ncbi:hypothetical protein EDC96DRAFT_493385 [Choanephora cucurbitarum]|nr:hypothetical protein EDC96DRAFT_493385 [Choanephora cucurbitarum]